MTVRDFMHMLNITGLVCLALNILFMDGQGVPLFVVGILFVGNSLLYQLMRMGRMLPQEWFE